MLSSHRALFVHAGTLGDFVLSLRIVAGLRAAGAAGVTIVARRPMIDLALIGGADRVIDFEGPGMHRLFAPGDDAAQVDPAPFAGHARVVNAATSADSAFTQRLAALTGGEVVCLDPLPRPGFSVHITDQWFADLKTAGLELPDVGAPRLTLPRADIRTARAELSAGEGDRIALLHPGSGGRKKCWPIESWLSLASDLSRGGWTCRWLVGPVEEDTWPAADLDRLARSAPVLRNQSLRSLAAMMAAADLFVGNDSGASHLAAAAGAPTVAIFGPTATNVWRPLGDRVRVVATDSGDWPDCAAVLAAIQALC